MNLPWEAQLILAGVVGLLVGLLVMWLLLRQSGDQKKQHEALVQKFSDYRQDVDKHFVETAAAVDELNRSYQKVVQHLSQGAQSLMGQEALQEQLAKRSDTIAQVFEQPETAGTTAREKAIVQFSIKITEQPAALDAGDIDALQAEGLNEGEILDLLHSDAIFAWANRLMLNLGEAMHL